MSLTESDLSKAVYATRGRILQFAIEMEKMIEIYIAERFATNDKKIREMIIVILAPRLTLSQKKEVFEYLLERHHPKFKNKYKREFSYLQDLISQRNVFAHWPVEFSPRAIYRFNKLNSITYVRLKNTKINRAKKAKLIDRQFYTEKKVNSWIAKFLKLNNVLKKLINEVAPPSKHK